LAADNLVPLARIGFNRSSDFHLFPQVERGSLYRRVHFVFKRDV
jgi:hypothetical protein